MAEETATLTDATDVSDPEHLVVFEIVGTIPGFIRATQGVEGLNFVDDIVGLGIEPDEDFCYLDKDGDLSARRLPQKLYLVIVNARAVHELIRLFELYKHDQNVKFNRGLAPLKQVFKLLHTVRRWGPEDRVGETGLLDRWREDIEIFGESLNFLRVEIELVWRDTTAARGRAQIRVQQILDATPGAVMVATAVIESIHYHAILAELPRSQVELVLREDPGAIDLLCCEDVLFASPSVPMSFSLAESEEGEVAIDAALPEGEPTVALLDGLPLANHDVLTGRLIIDDPCDRETEYSASQRGHGTEMASLIVHGDLNDPGPSLSTPLYVYPVLVPAQSALGQETAPKDELFVDVIHAAFQRLMVQDNQAGKSVRIVNLSIGEPARVFIRRMSPLARLIDYLMVVHNILVIVSAGNHKIARSHEAGIKLRVSNSALAGDKENLDQAIRASWFHTARQRGLLAPAEAINAITVGAIHEDAAKGHIPDTVIDPQARGSIAAYSSSGFGHHRSPKPDLFAPGGRALVVRPTHQDHDSTEIVLERAEMQALGPGIRTAAAGDGFGTSNFAYTHGTSNAAALTTRAAAQIEEELRRLELERSEWDFLSPEYHPVLIKTLLVHASSWPDEAGRWAEQLDISGKHRRRALTQMLGFGVLDPLRAVAASRTRACVIGAGAIDKDQRHSFRFPLPPSLSNYVGWRRLIVTLAWFSPIMPRTQQYRVAHLSFGFPRDQLKVTPKEVDHHANGNGTVLHEVLVGEHAAGYTVDDELAIDVDCRVRVGRLNEPVRFGLAATLEVGQDVHIDVYGEISQRLREQARAVRVQAAARV
ncbi:MAG: S8 family peptidase [bacterium]|nr:S8 family peptidase [bacterium]